MWLITGKVVHMILSFVIGLITARYLGPSNYGLIGYAGTFTTFFAIFCNLGINSVILKNFVDHPDEEGETLGTTFVLRFVSSVLSIGLIFLITSIADRGEPVTITVVTLYSVSLVFHIFDSFHQWFQSRFLSKYYAIATLISYLFVSAYKIVLLVTHCSVEWFAVSNSVDYIVVAMLLYAFYRSQNGPAFSASFRKAKELLSVSVSYILAGMMTAIYAATDKFMLKQMLDESTVGYYTLAVSVSSMWVFVLSAIIESMSPQIMEYHNASRDQYLRTNKKLYALVFYLSILASAGICLIAPLFIRIVYGEAYAPSAALLRVIVWYTAFSHLGVARNVWVVCEKKQKYLKYLYFGSALTNVGLNLLLIPMLGAVGAAVASLLTQFSTVFVFPLLFRELRPNVRLMMEGILLRGVFDRKKEGDDYV